MHTLRDLLTESTKMPGFEQMIEDPETSPADIGAWIDANLSRNTAYRDGPLWEAVRFEADAWWSRYRESPAGIVGSLSDPQAFQRAARKFARAWAVETLAYNDRAPGFAEQIKRRERLDPSDSNYDHNVYEDVLDTFCMTLGSRFGPDDYVRAACFIGTTDPTIVEIPAQLLQDGYGSGWKKFADEARKILDET